jgi:hypothetical protein
MWANALRSPPSSLHATTGARPKSKRRIRAVPLCRTHHRAAHRAGDERAWWVAAGRFSAAVGPLGWLHKEFRDVDSGRPSKAIENVDSRVFLLFGPAQNTLHGPR